MKLLKGKNYNPGDKRVISGERKVSGISFNIHKFKNKIKPDKTKQIIVNCLSEFGCEILGVLYNLPRIRQTYPGCYLIAIGWYGRAYLYRHLVDEFWEIKEEFQWLRDYCRAFHHASKNIAELEKTLKTQCRTFISCHQMGQLVIGARCNNCSNFWGTNNYINNCPRCKSVDVQQSLFGDMTEWKKVGIKIPQPSEEKMELARNYLKPNSVGVFARGRKTYGRNLSPDFYINLIKMIKSMGYNIVWLGEKQNVLPCPVSEVLDFSQLPESRDLELTLAIIKQLKFTIQFWTASTRLSSIVGTPYILFESPDQIWGNGQEGYRRYLCDFGPGKLVASHYLEVKEKPQEALEILEKTIKEVELGNFEDVLGLLTNIDCVSALRDNYQKRTNYGIF